MAAPSHSSSASRLELRGEIDADLAQALDAIALARGLTRHAYVTSVLKAEVVRIAT